MGESGKGPIWVDMSRRTYGIVQWERSRRGVVNVGLTNLQNMEDHGERTEYMQVQKLE